MVYLNTMMHSPEDNLEFPESQGPVKQLLEVLTIDHTPPEKQAIINSPYASELEKYDAATVNEARAHERLYSPESVALHNRVKSILEASPATDIFKNLIATYAAKAYIFESRLDDYVSPDVLGLTNGGYGIFDPFEVQGIETGRIHGLLFHIIESQIITGKDPSNPEQTTTVVINPKRFNPLLTYLKEWNMDFMLHYGESAFDTSDPIMYAKLTHKLDGLDPTTPHLGNVVNRLSQLQSDEEHDAR